MPRHAIMPTGLLAALMTAGALGAQVPQAVLDHDRQMAQLAIEVAANGPATPIPLMGARGRLMGVVYDQFVTGVLIARARTASGDSPTPETLLSHPNWQSRALVVVAYPVDCDGKPNHPTAIRWAANAALPVAPATIGTSMRGAAGAAVLPGVGLPDDALTVAFRNLPMFNAGVEITYDGPVCHGAATTESLSIVTSPSRALSTAFAGVKMPDAFASLPMPATVRMSVTLDSAGRARFPTQLQGPPELGAVATELLASRTFPPSAVNGVPMPMGMLVALVFTATGAPAPPAPYVPAQPPPGVTTMTSSSVVAVPSARPAPSLPPVPAAPAGQTNAQLTRLAIEIGQTSDPTPVSLDAAGPPVHGLLFDGFLVTALKARAAFKAGTPVDPASTSLSAVQEDLVAVAFPLTCDGRTIAPKDVSIAMGGVNPGPLRETSALLFRGELEGRLPGVTVPAGAAGRAFANIPLSQNLEVRVTYAEAACGTASPVLTLPIQWVRGQSEPRLGTAKLPSASSLPSPTVVRLRGLVDLSGAYRYPTLADGPAELGPTAIVTASNWKYQPYRANGTPMPQGVITTLTFTASGMPEPAAAPSVPVPGAPPTVVDGPPVLTSSTINGRPPEMTTADVAGLSAATSKCEIAGDAAYGHTAGSPIKVGGGFAQGPARERQYLTVLRGPAGQGLSLVRRGSVLAPDGQTILDLYDLTYEGLAKPLQLYLDEYREEPLKAPQGLVCAAAIVVR